MSLGRTDVRYPELMSIWLTRSLPVLQWVADHEGTKTVVSLGDIADAVGLSADDVDAELERLHRDGLVHARIGRTMNGGNAAGWHVASPRLTGAGARALGEWPDAERFLAVIEHLANDEPDVVKRSAIARVAGVMREVGTTVVSDMLVAYLRSVGHLP